MKKSEKESTNKKDNEFKVFGLENINKNGCYFNCVYQLLFHSEIFRERVVSLWIHLKDLPPRIRKRIMILYEVCRQFLLLKATSFPKSFCMKKTHRLLYKSINARNGKLADGKQHDAEELLSFLFDVLDTQFKFVSTYFKKRNSINLRDKANPFLRKRITTDVFRGSHIQVLKCEECGVSNIDRYENDPEFDISSKEESFYILNLATNRKVSSLRYCLNQYYEPEVLSEDNKVYCAYCRKKTVTTSRSQIEKLPRILIIRLKRYTSKSAKVNHRIILPLQHPVINIPNSFIRKREEEKEDEEEEGEQEEESDVSYRLFSLICHRGGSRKSGHYYTYVRKLSEKKNSSEGEYKWYRLNDKHVHLVTDPVIEREFGSVETDRRCRSQRGGTVYILGFERVV